MSFDQFSVLIRFPVSIKKQVEFPWIRKQLNIIK